MELKRDLAIAAGYLAAMGTYVYGIENPGIGYGNEAFAIALLSLVGALHLTAGFALAEAWALFLPGAAVLISVPAGYPNDVAGESVQIWRWLLLLALPEAVLIAVGSALRSFLARRRALISH